jgi:hypothetical protein
MTDDTRFGTEGNRPIPESIEFELRQRLNVLALDAWLLRRLGRKKMLPFAVIGVIDRREKTIARISDLLNAAGVPPQNSPGAR